MAKITPKVYQFFCVSYLVYKVYEFSTVNYHQLYIFELLIGHYYCLNFSSDMKLMWFTLIRFRIELNKRKKISNPKQLKFKYVKGLPSSVADRIDKDFLQLKIDGEDRKESEEDWMKAAEIVELLEGRHNREDEHPRVAENAIASGM